MSRLREIRDRISSIQDTMKITNAMYLISSTKMRKARKSLEMTEPYFDALQLHIERILRHLPEDFTHPFLEVRNQEEGVNPRRAIIVITGDKGLAGAYNRNVLKMAQEMNPDSNDRLFVVGQMGRRYFEHRNMHVDEQFQFTAQNPTLHRARQISRRMLELYTAKEIDEVYILYTRMVNRMVMEPCMQQLLPLSGLNSNMIPGGVEGLLLEDFHWDPTPEDVISNVIPGYIAGFIYGALVESFCSEHNSRMMAMDAAGRNGAELTGKLRTVYNRERQAKITQEITEISAGAKMHS